ncbi:MAG: flagellar hook-length control protein FliK [Pirellulaceae bacterium]|nr:flagellar hook-length control protein FliK [Pirellulaceae bacterium]
MDGSIADSTTLRIRSHLQRAYQDASNTHQHGFFEELLKLPVASTVDSDDNLPPDEVLTDSLSPTSDAQATRDDEPAVDEKLPEDDEDSLQLLEPCVVICYAPVQIDETGQEPHVAAVTEGEPSHAVPTDVVAPPSLEPTDQALVPTSPDDSPLPIIDQATQTIVPTDSRQELTGPARTPDNPTLVSAALPQRSVRSAKTSHEKSSTENVTPAQKPAVTPVPSSTARPEAKPEVKPETDDSAAELVVQAAQPVVESEDEATTKSSDKWYLSDKSSHVGAGEPLSLAERLAGDTLQAQQDVDQQAGHEASQATPASELYAQLDGSGLDHAAEVNDNLVQAGSMSEAAAMAEAAQMALASAMQTGGSADGSSASSNRIAGAEASSVSRVGATTAGQMTGNSDGAIGGGTSGRSSSGVAAGTRHPEDAGTSDSDVRTLSQQERVRLVQRVARSFSRLGPDGGQVTLKLHPPQLGVLNVSIKIEGHTMSARLQTESSAARDVILENLPVLRERLSEQGIEVDKFQVEVATADEMQSDTGQTGGSLSSGSFGSGTGEGRDSGSASAVDYRRLSRASASRAQVAAPTLPDSILSPAWRAGDRSLAVRA